ncbi:MAG: hypothetical protein AB7K68_14475 [Bacteriovoracia bacterium]
MKILFVLLTTAFLSANASASTKAYDIYTVLKNAGLSDEPLVDVTVYQERMYGVYCTKQMSTYECGLDRDDAEGRPIRLVGSEAKKLYSALLDRDVVNCDKNSCSLFVDVIQCSYTVDKGFDPAKLPSLKDRTACEITTTKKI